jgi:hypothetical protein
MLLHVMQWHITCLVLHSCTRLPGASHQLCLQSGWKGVGGGIITMQGTG